jgi:hypothetical protein
LSGVPDELEEFGSGVLLLELGSVLVPLELPELLLPGE